MSLGDHFPEELKEGFAERSLQVGMVLKLFVKDTKPPKEKRFIVMGKTADGLCLATVYINSELNEKVNWSQELKDQQVYFTAEGRDYLDWGSYIDCSKLLIKDYAEIHSIVKIRPSSVLGSLSEEDFNCIKNKIISSTTIKGKHKKKFGFFC